MIFNKAMRCRFLITKKEHDIYGKSLQSDLTRLLSALGNSNYTPFSILSQFYFRRGWIKLKLSNLTLEFVSFYAKLDLAVSRFFLVLL